MERYQHTTPTRAAEQAPSSTANDDVGPVLPDRPTTSMASTGASTREQTPPSGAVLPALPNDLESYVAPRVLSTREAERALMVSRILLAAWACAAAIATVVLRSRGADDLTSTSVMQSVALIGCALAVLTALSGWWWMDRHVVNLHRFDRRIPGRNRAATGWLAPVVVFAVLSLTVARMSPTETVDIKPAILVLGFTFSVWRPYAVCRRVLRSYTRIDADGLLGTALVLDLAGFGLLWWQLSSWPDFVDPDTVAVVDPLLGQALAAALAFIAGAWAWYAIIGAMQRGREHRAGAHATHHLHRQLRLRGIEPMDPQVRWALHQIQVDEGTASVDWGRRSARREHTEAERPGPDPMPETTAPRRIVRPVIEPAPDAPAASQTGLDPLEELLLRRDVVDDAPAVSQTGLDPLDELLLRPDAADVVLGGRDERHPNQPPNESVPGRELARVDDDDRGARALELAPAGDNILDRLSEYGITPPDASSPVAPASHPSESESELSRPIRLLEFVRAVMLLVFLGAAVALAFLARSIAAAEVVEREITESSLRSIDDMRLVVAGVVGAALILVSLWALLTTLWAGRRAGIEVRRDMYWCAVALGIALTGYVVAFIVDAERGLLSAVTLSVSAGAVALVLYVVKDVDLELGGDSRSLNVCSALLVLIPTTWWALRFDRAPQPDDSVAVALFFVVVQAMACGFIVIAFVVAVRGIEERIRLARGDVAG